MTPEITVALAKLPPGPAGLDTAQAIAIADELVDLTHRLSDLAYDLGSDSHTLRAHMQSLQSIDLITQIQLALADLLRSSAPFTERLNGITVESLAQRLEAKLAPGA